MEETIKENNIQYIYDTSLRGLLNKANKMNLTKNEIISINKSEGQFFLVYCKD